MTALSTLARAATLAGLIAGGLAAPALAGPTEAALLQSYLGEWRGRGTLIGATTESVVCRMSVTQGNQDKINYSGRCALAGTTLSVAGTMAYIDASRRYEAAMTSNANFTGLAVGRKRGNTIVFDLREREQDEHGKDLNVTAQITLSGDAVQINFDVVYVESGDSLSAIVPFSR